MPLASSTKRKIIQVIGKGEGRSEHFYLDTKGYVTIGIGFLVRDASALHGLTMYKSANQKNSKTILASYKEKLAEFNYLVKNRATLKGLYYKDFKKHTNLFVLDKDIDALFQIKLTSFYREIKSLYAKNKGYKSDFDNFPSEVQVALFDMIYNLGMNKLGRDYKKMNAAIKKEDWKTAAGESGRLGIGSSRNSEIKALFMAAHNRSQTKKKQTIKP